MQRGRWRPDVVAVVFAGGCLGGATRYWVTSAYPGRSYSFPWSTLLVNLAGAFVLAFVVVVATKVLPSRYLRPLVGTGFCGALTTFSSVVVAADRLFAHHRAGTAAAYLAATAGGGLLAAVLGLGLARALPVARRRGTGPA
jgi:CrcB protein